MTFKSFTLLVKLHKVTQKEIHLGYTLTQMVFSAQETRKIYEDRKETEGKNSQKPIINLKAISEAKLALRK